jgi:hypothetical protein
MAKNNNKSEITIESLSRDERQSLLTLLRYSHSLYLRTETDATFKVWLDMLGEGLNDAIKDYISKTQHS